MQQTIFPNDPNVLHLELGAGCGDFGKRFYPLCYLTDIPDFMDACSTNHIDHYCSATALPWGAARFKIVIMCNPYKYGFAGYDEAEELLDSIIAVLQNDGKVLVLSSERNPWGKPSNIQRQVKAYNEAKGTDIVCTSCAIDATLEYPNYVFYQTEGNKPTVPNCQCILSNF